MLVLNINILMFSREKNNKITEVSALFLLKNQLYQLILKEIHFFLRRIKKFYTQKKSFSNII